MHQMTRPVGLVYTNAGGQAPGELIGAWYTIANPEVCEFFGVPNPENCPTGQPEGFDGQEDFTADTNAVQQAWHTHTGLCGGSWGSSSAQVVETFSTATEPACMSGDYVPCPCAWFESYGWMMHLYHFIPNPDGRFMRWNTNVVP